VVITGKIVIASTALQSQHVIHCDIQQPVLCKKEESSLHLIAAYNQVTLGQI